MEPVVCKYFQSGFCKFQEYCRKQHVKELCETDKCTSKVCIKRHPKVCKYFKTHNACKFNDLCAYQHIITTETSPMEELVNKINNLENIVNVMSKQIDVLTNLEDTVKAMSDTIQVLEVKIQSIHNESNISTNKSFKCDHCDYIASKNSVLKRHVTSKHKPKIPAPEKERNKDHDKSLQLFLSPEERAPEEEQISPSKLEENHIIPRKTSFNCELCKHESKSSVALNGHISLNHNMRIPHTGKWEDNKCHICNHAFNNTCHFKNHLIEQHGFLDDSNECMNCESTEVGLYRAMPFQSVCMNCKHCELLESNM